MTKRNVAILCSGFGLGFYIPGALIHKQLIAKGYSSFLYVFEKYITIEKQMGISVSRSEYHKDLKVALASTKMPFDIRNSLDMNYVENLLNEWEEKEIYNFVSISGHWGYVLDYYSNRVNKKIHVDSLFIDAELTPSWRGLLKYNPEYFNKYNNITFYDPVSFEINLSIFPNEMLRTPLKDRENRLVVHGGGWGLGNYKDTVQNLLSLDYELDIVAYTEDDVTDTDSKITYYMNQPTWNCWEIDSATDPLFPPYTKYIKGETNNYTISEDYHWLFDNINKAKAIVSKPGAGTLIDSFASNTPIILMKPFGAHESQNYLVWKKLGFGISLEEWKEMQYDQSVLLEMSNKIANYKEVPRYIDKLLDSL